MKPLVIVSLEDETGDRCVDILDLRDGCFGFVECRRDPEDGHGWRHLEPATGGFDSEVSARAAAKQTVTWLENQ